MKSIFILSFFIPLILLAGCGSRINIFSSDNIILWSDHWGTDKNDIGNDTATDSIGNAYVTGVTLGSLDDNKSAGEWDIFLSKHDPSGIRKWTRQWGTSGRDEGKGIAIDHTGNIYVTGRTSGRLDGSTFFGSSDIFVTKYNCLGVKQWTIQWGTDAFDCGQDITINSSGDIVVTGYTEGNLDGRENKGKADIFLSKFNSSGIKLWTVLAGTDSSEWGTSAATDKSGNIFITGWTKGNLKGNTSAGSTDIFLIKYDSAGNIIWTRQWGTEGNDEGNSIAIDSSEMIYVTGRANGELDGNKRLGRDDIFLTKYSSSGIKKWTKQWGTENIDKGYGVVTDSSDNIYVTGHTWSKFKHNINSGNSDFFLTKFDLKGKLLWTRQFGTAGFDWAWGIAIDNSGSLYITGDTSCDLNGKKNLGDNRNIYLAKWVINK